MEVEGWLDRAAARHPQRSALETPAGSWSYAELLTAASAGARELKARGAARASRVAIALPPGLGFAQALHACLMLGAVAVPVDPRLTAPERALISEGAAVLVEEPLGDPASEATGSGVLADSSRPPAVRHRLEDTAVVIHTSGTTASPTPVELTYGNLLWSAIGSAAALGVQADERWLCTLPVSHVGGLSILVRSAIYGTTAVIHERFDTQRALQALRGEGITLVSLVARTLARLLDAGLGDPPALRCALTGGGPVPATLLDRARAAGVPVGLTYGLTEASSQVTTVPVGSLGGDEKLGEASPSAGLPLFCTRVRIATDEEILVAGPTVAPGSLSSDGWLYTGDLGELDELGRLHVRGRKADTIISGGENVAPAEVEAVLEAHPYVREAAVLGRADDQWGEAVTAIVVAREGALIDGETLREYCAQKLAPYKVPKLVTLVSDPLPRTPSGKLLRRELEGALQASRAE